MHAARAAGVLGCVAAAALAGCSATTRGPAPSASSFLVSGEFHALRVADGFSVTVVPGTSDLAVAEVTAPPQDVDVRIVDGVLQLRVATRPVPADTTLRATVSASSLDAVQATTGATVVFAEGAALSGQRVRADLSAGAELTADVATAALAVGMQAGSRATVSGTAGRARIEAAQSADLRAERLSVADADVSAGSGSTVALTVTRSLAARASSGAVVRYLGDPRVTRREESSGGSVVHGTVTP